MFASLAESEPRSMLGQPPVIWHRAEGIQVHDPWGNTWLDWSSGVLITNAGHGRQEITRAAQEVLERPLHATYVFIHEGRVQLTRLLRELTSNPEANRVFLVSTGSEATENAMKLARTYGIQKGGRRKHVIVSFEGAFHGRTLGAQLAGGIDALKEWIVKTDVGFVQVPFPDGFRNRDVSFEGFRLALEAQNVEPQDVAGVISETYQGVGPNFFPTDYAQALESWCREHDVVLIMDEVQSGFGRTGRMFAFEHYDITPDLICCGKGISSSFPIAAVIGRADIMDLYPPGSMTSTHSGSPVPTAAAIANLKLIQDEQLVENAAALDVPLRDGLLAIQAAHPGPIGAVMSRGLVAGLLIVKPGTLEPDAELARDINERCFEKGLLMFAPVGLGGGCVKIAPPLTTPLDALEEGIAVLAEACEEILGG
jgi:4-aminobutyrate aminotransferase-like enzyme